MNERYDEYEDFFNKDENQPDEKFDIDSKDFLALFIAIVQTTLLPIVFMFIILLIMAIGIGMLAGS